MMMSRVGLYTSVNADLSSDSMTGHSSAYYRVWDSQRAHIGLGFAKGKARSSKLHLGLLRIDGYGL